MATGIHPYLRRRISAAQLYAVSQVEREIRAVDPHSQRKYLREFTEAFQSYSTLVSSSELMEELLQADVLLVADYHTLPASQHYAATLIQQLSSGTPTNAKATDDVGDSTPTNVKMAFSDVSSRRRPVVLALEAIYSRDQRILDDWQDGHIQDRELREGIRYDRQWGFRWEPFLLLLKAARSANVRVYGLDCVPRGDLRRISTRDERAAGHIAEIARIAPEAAFVVLFGRPRGSAAPASRDQAQDAGGPHPDAAAERGPALTGKPRVRPEGPSRPSASAMTCSASSAPPRWKNTKATGNAWQAGSRDTLRRLTSRLPSTT